MVAATEEPLASEPIPLAADEERWDTRQFGDRRRPTTAEQAVPWLVGAVLALAGIVIVLLALIFSDANGGFGSASLEPTPLVGASASTPPSPSVAASPSASPRPSVSPTAVPTKPPTYGILEMFYLTRPSAVAFSELLRDDFATAALTFFLRDSHPVPPSLTRVTPSPSPTVYFWTRFIL